MAEPTPPSRTEDEAAMIEAVEAGLASLDAGQSIPYEVVRRWLLSWGVRDEKP